MFWLLHRQKLCDWRAYHKTFAKKLYCAKCGRARPVVAERGYCVHCGEETAGEHYGSCDCEVKPVVPVPV